MFTLAELLSIFFPLSWLIFKILWKATEEAFVLGTLNKKEKKHAFTVS